jgi:hypothetical protein
VLGGAGQPHRDRKAALLAGVATLGQRGAGQPVRGRLRDLRNEPTLRLSDDALRIGAFAYARLWGGLIFGV